MDTVKVLIVSHSTELINLVESNNKYETFFSKIEFIQSEKLSVSHDITVVIFDLPDDELNINEISLYANQVHTLVCVSPDSPVIANIASCGIFNIVSRPATIDTFFLTLHSIPDLFANASSLVKIADIDYLTELQNRRGLYSDYSALAPNTNMHFMYLDIDNFKVVNDLFGHSVGDSLLIKVTKLIRNNTKDASVYRVGGDEFTVMFNGSYSEDEIIDIANHMLFDICHIDMSKEIQSAISLSIGIILDQSSKSNLDDILYKCDAAMYHAKKNGKNQFVMYHDIEHDLMYHKSISMEKELALTNGEFEVYYQPKVNMITNRLYGAEALVRWNHPIDGLRMPAKFISLFEENGFILKLDMYVFEQSCKLKKRWYDNKETFCHTYISVNMSRLHLYEKNFVSDLIKITDKYEINKREIEIEFTESVFLKDSDAMVKVVSSLKNAGFCISIDDFGSGYSTLNILKDTPVDIIKIDQDFLKRFDEDSKSRRIIRSIISMAKDLRLETVAEGVETTEQINFLTSCGCELAQGYYFAKPMPIKDFEVFAENHLLEIDRVIEYKFNNNFNDESGEYNAEFIGDGYHFGEGVTDSSHSLYFPGGRRTRNVMQIPVSAMPNESFTVCFWMKTETIDTWTSVFFVTFESGFLSIVPLAWGGVSILRVKDERERGGWYDAGNQLIPTNEWTHVAITYNAKSEVMRLFINSNLAGFKDYVPPMSAVRRIYLGGDVYKKSFCGSICDLSLFEQVKSTQDIRQIYTSYVDDPTFKGPKMNY